jgi:WD40 repeat protein
VYKDGQSLLSGDSNGMLKIWDLRKDEAKQVIPNDVKQSPISHISVSKGSKKPIEEGRFIAVSSYDNGNEKKKKKN